MASAVVGLGVDHSEDDRRSDGTGRSETKIERLDRNWASLLQELRVVQTGVQLLTGLLLTLPFQQHFDILDHDMRVVYLVTVASSVAATVLLVAPVGMHRLLFRRHRINVLVAAAHLCAYAGLLLLGAAMVGVTVLVFEAVVGRHAALIAGAWAFVAFATFWVAVPLAMRLGRPGPQTR
jgi:hypothetical protein